MSHRPYPNTDRALRQVHRGRIRWVQPAHAGTSWLLGMRQGLLEMRQSLSTITVPVQVVSPGRAVLPGGVSVEVKDGSMPIEEAVRRSLVRITPPAGWL